MDGVYLEDSGGLFRAFGRSIYDKISRMSGSGLKAKVIQGAIALGIGKVAGGGLKFVRYMLLARLLAPGEFGQMAIVSLVAMAFQSFTEVGVRQSVIQNRRGAEYEYLNAAFWMQAVRGLGLFAAGMVLAPFISNFYGMPGLLKLLQVSFFAVLSWGFISPRAHLLEKEYKFGWAVILKQGSSILGTIVTVALAFFIGNVWSLVLGFTAEAALMCLLSYLLVPFMPSLKIDKKSLRELMQFARGMFGLPILAMISFQTDIMVLGKMVPKEYLGMYSLAAMLAYTPVEWFTHIINPVLLPAFAQKQDNRKSLCQAVLKVTRTTAIFGMPLIAFMVVCASSILLVVYGHTYVAVAAPFAVLCLNILLRTQGVVLFSAYLAVGQPGLHRRFVLLRSLILVGLIYPAILYFGLLGAAAVVFVSGFIAFVMQVFWCRRIIDLKFGSYVRCYIPGLLLSAPVVAVVAALLSMGIKSPSAVLFSGVAALLAALLAGLYILHRQEGLFALKERAVCRGSYVPLVGLKSA